MRDFYKEVLANVQGTAGNSSKIKFWVIRCSSYRELTVYWKKFSGIWNSSRYNLRSQNTFEIPFRSSVYSGTESISYLGLKVSELVPDNWEELTHGSVSKNK